MKGKHCLQRSSKSAMRGSKLHKTKALISITILISQIKQGSWEHNVLLTSHRPYPWMKGPLIMQSALAKSTTTFLSKNWECGVVNLLAELNCVQGSPSSISAKNLGDRAINEPWDIQKNRIMVTIKIMDAPLNRDANRDGSDVKVIGSNQGSHR